MSCPGGRTTPSRLPRPVGCLMEAPLRGLSPHSPLARGSRIPRLVRSPRPQDMLNVSFTVPQEYTGGSPQERAVGLNRRLDHQDVCSADGEEPEDAMGLDTALGSYHTPTATPGSPFTTYGEQYYSPTGEEDESTLIASDLESSTDASTTLTASRRRWQKPEQHAQPRMTAGCLPTWGTSVSDAAKNPMPMWAQGGSLPEGYYPKWARGGSPPKGTSGSPTEPVPDTSGQQTPCLELQERTGISCSGQAGACGPRQASEACSPPEEFFDAPGAVALPPNLEEFQRFEDAAGFLDVGMAEEQGPSSGGLASPSGGCIPRRPPPPIGRPRSTRGDKLRRRAIANRYRNQAASGSAPPPIGSAPPPNEDFARFLSTNEQVRRAHARLMEQIAMGPTEEYIRNLGLPEEQATTSEGHASPSGGSIPCSPPSPSGGSIPRRPPSPSGGCIPRRPPSPSGGCVPRRPPSPSGGCIPRRPPSPSPRPPSKRDDRVLRRAIASRGRTQAASRSAPLTKDDVSRLMSTNEEVRRARARLMEQIAMGPTEEYIRNLGMPEEQATASEGHATTSEGQATASGGQATTPGCQETTSGDQATTSGGHPSPSGGCIPRPPPAPRSKRGEKRRRRAMAKSGQNQAASRSAPPPNEDFARFLSTNEEVRRAHDSLMAQIAMGPTEEYIRSLGMLEEQATTSGDHASPSGGCIPCRPPSPSGGCIPRRPPSPSGGCIPRRPPSPSGGCIPRRPPSPSGGCIPRRPPSPSGGCTPRRPPSPSGRPPSNHDDTLLRRAIASSCGNQAASQSAPPTKEDFARLMSTNEEVRRAHDRLMAQIAMGPTEEYIRNLGTLEEQATASEGQASPSGGYIPRPPPLPSGGCIPRRPPSPSGGCIPRRPPSPSGMPQSKRDDNILRRAIASRARTRAAARSAPSPNENLSRLMSTNEQVRRAHARLMEQIAMGPSIEYIRNLEMAERRQPPPPSSPGSCFPPQDASPPPPVRRARSPVDHRRRRATANSIQNQAASRSYGSPNENFFGLSSTGQDFMDTTSSGDACPPPPVHRPRSPVDDLRRRAIASTGQNQAASRPRPSPNESFFGLSSMDDGSCTPPPPSQQQYQSTGYFQAPSLAAMPQVPRYQRAPSPPPLPPVRPRSPQPGPSRSGGGNRCIPTNVANLLDDYANM